MVGHTILHYRVEAELGRGGMGVVYRARDERLRRPVALKLLNAEMAGRADHRGRLLEEAQAASALNHPSITTIYEVAEVDGQIFIVMELVTGQTLREALRMGAMDPRPLARVGAQVAEGLAAAHAQGVIHGDIKPENVMLQPDGRVKLLDFGIARRLADETVTLTLQSTAPPEARPEIAGTLAYMAPEQFHGETVDARSDLFSLGTVLYELAAGHRPHPGPTSSSLMAQILNDPAPPLPASRIPVELARIIRKLLEKRPDARYQSAREVQVDLTNLIRDLEMGAAPAAVSDKRAVAVLPFRLLTPHPEDDYLGVALADAVVNHLSAGGTLLVRPTSAVLRYARPGADLDMAARELNVDILVDGSIQRLGQRLRVHVQAWNAADGSTLLSGKHESDLVNLFGLQDHLADAVGRALGSKPASEAPSPTPVPPTRNSEAYEFFLRAMERLARLNRWDMHTAIEMLEKATELDPKFADAWARLAEACVQMGVTFEPGPQWFRRADQALRRALALDPTNAEAKCVRGQVLWTPAKRFQNRAALRLVREALEANPGCLQAQVWQGLILLHVGLHDTAREVLLAALARHPDDSRTLVFIGQNALFQGNLAEADEYYLRALSIDPASIWANLFYPSVALYAGNPERAAEKVQAAAKVLPGEATIASLEALLWAHRGENRKASQAIQRALRGGKPLLHTHHMLHNLADTYALIGKPVQAVNLLRKAAGMGLPNYPAFRNDPHFRSLHTHPQFLRLMGDLKRDWTSFHEEFATIGA
jgi:TolB-like protein/Tfp pilus assembly protein PilF/predicted Ser/Thr protein kinase